MVPSAASRSSGPERPQEQALGDDLVAFLLAGPSRDRRVLVAPALHGPQPTGLIGPAVVSSAIKAGCRRVDVDLQMEPDSTTSRISRFHRGVHRSRPRRRVLRRASTRDHAPDRRGRLRRGTLSIAYWLVELIFSGPSLSLLVLSLFNIPLGGAALLVARRVQVDPGRDDVRGLITMIEIVAGAGFLSVALSQPTRGDVHGLSVLVLLLAIFFGIPNRFLTNTIIGLAIAIGYGIIAVATFTLPSAASFTQMVSVGGVVAIGILHSNQLARVRREEFLALRSERAANARLASEVARRELLEGELRTLATRDALTGLQNRRAFLEAAEVALAERVEVVAARQP